MTLLERAADRRLDLGVSGQQGYEGHIFGKDIPLGTRDASLERPSGHVEAEPQAPPVEFKLSSKDHPMKTIRRFALLTLLALGAASCGTASLLAPDCDDPAACDYQPGSNG